jgi:general L-amino acid transport system permease protein
MTSQPHLQRQTIPFYRNVRVLAVLAQVLFIGLVLALGWLVWTTMQHNLQRQGIPVSFTFLRQPAGFGIAEGVPFNPSQSYLTAFGVGIVNTLRAAVIGIMLATLLGIAIGVARLSHNWLLERCATAYVETFRNVPLLLWLIFTYAAIRETLPRVQEALTLLAGAVLVSNRGLALLWPQSSVTFAAFWPWLLIGAGLGVGIGWWSRRIASRHGEVRTAWGIVSGLAACMVLWAIGFVYVWGTARLPATTTIDPEAEVVFLDLNRNGTQEALEPPLAGVRVTAHGPEETVTDLTLADGSFRLPSASPTEQQLTLSAPPPLVWSVPRVQGFNYRGGLVLSPEFTALLCGLVLYTAAFIAEIVRAGILAVARGQREAAKALGFSDWHTFTLIIFPQALRVIIPPLINQYLNLTKNSSLAIAVGYPDLFSIGLTINNQTGQAIPFVMMIMVTYLSMSLLTSWVLNLVNTRMALKTR